MEQCSFSPKIRTMPAFIERMAQSHAAKKSADVAAGTYTAKYEGHRASAGQWM